MDAATLMAAVLAGLPDPAEWRRNDRSSTAELLISGDRVVAKMRAQDIAGLQREARALERAAAIQEIEDVRAVRLVGLDVSRGVLVTRYAPGGSAFNLVWNSTSIVRPHLWRHRTTAMDLPRRVGRWLRALHEVPNPEPVPHRDRKCHLHQALLRKIDGIESRAAHLLRGPLNLATRQLCERLIASSSWDELRTVCVHGDLTLSNLVTTVDGNATVLDFGDSQSGFALEDVVRFWCSVRELARTGRVRRWLLRDAADRFLSEYGLADNVASSAPFRYLVVWNAVNRLSEHAWLLRGMNAWRYRREHRRLVMVARSVLSEETQCAD